jgi:transcriptional regulator with XRE-family HTH domain
MTSRFGARLRQHREQQNVSLTTVADRTKIKASLLEGLERDDISHWPPGIFRRAYIRAYAEAIGLDPETTIREFLEVYPEPVEIVETPPPATGFRGLVGSALESLSRRRHNGSAHGDPVTVAHPGDTKEPERPSETVPTMGRLASPETPPPSARRHVDLVAAARLCTALGRVETAAEVQPLLREAAAILDATGLIVWVWRPLEQELRPVMVHGYAPQVLARLPPVKRDDNNLTAAAFRTEKSLSANETPDASAALALPLLTPGSCAGVLTLELARGNETTRAIRPVATIFAAMLAQLVGGAAEDTDHRAQSSPQFANPV